MPNLRSFPASWPVIGLIAGVLLLATIGTLASAQQIPSPTKIWSDPDKGLSEDEIAARQRANTAGFESRYRAWFADFVKSGVDVRTLRKSPLMKSPLPGPASLKEASDTADTIVVGVVGKVEFEPFGGAFVTVRVESGLKGAQGQKEITVWMSGGPFPTQDFKGAILTYDESAPLLLPGDRAVLFLGKTDHASRQGSFLYPQNFTGVYKSESGRVVPVEGNPFKGAVSGLTESAFLANIRAALGTKSP